MAFNLSSEMTAGIAKVTLSGELDASVAETFRQAVSNLASQQPRKMVLDMTRLDYMASAGLRVLVFARQKMGADVDIYIIGANEAVSETIEMTGMQHSVTMLPEYDALEIEK